MLKITHRQMSGNGQGHEHIAYVYVEDTINPSRSRWWSVAEAHDYVVIPVNHLYVVDTVDGRLVDTHARVSTAGHKFIQTVADGRWTDNLLHLPEARKA